MKEYMIYPENSLPYLTTRNYTNNYSLEFLEAIRNIDKEFRTNLFSLIKKRENIDSIVLSVYDSFTFEQKKQDQKLIDLLDKLSKSYI